MNGSMDRPTSHAGLADELNLEEDQDLCTSRSQCRFRSLGQAPKMGPSFHLAVGQNLPTRNWTAGFSLCYHLPGFKFGYLFLTHGHLVSPQPLKLHLRANGRTCRFNSGFDNRPKAIGSVDKAAHKDPTSRKNNAVSGITHGKSFPSRTTARCLLKAAMPRNARVQPLGSVP